MFSRKKTEPQKKRNRDLSQFGIFDPTENYDDAGDSDLEAELAVITSGNKDEKPKQPEKKLIPSAELDKMIADSLRDIGSDEELSGDDDDPDLLGELQDLTGEAIDEREEKVSPVSDVKEGDEVEEKEQMFLPTSTINVIDILKNRIQMYELAENNAKATGESSRARRFNRGLITLKDMLKQASAGKSINVDEIPPEVSVGKGAQATTQEVSNGAEPTSTPSESPLRPAPPIPPRKPSSPPASQPEPPSSPASQSELPSSPASQPKLQSPTVEEASQVANESPKSPTSPLDKDSKLSVLNARKTEYKLAALQAKRANDKESALEFVKIIKQFDVVIKAAENGEEVDLSDMPPPPNELKEFLKQMKGQAEGAAAAPDSTPAPEPELPQKEPDPIPDAPKTILEGLQQRLDKYKSVEAAAKAEGNSSKARRYGRIVKQYEDAIKMHKAGKSVAYDELPVPPGFGPLPIEGSSPSVAQPAAATVSPTPKPGPSSSATKDNTTEDASSDSTPKSSPPKRPLRKQESAVRISGNQVPTTLVEKQMQILLQRQKEFKIAALEAKKAGDIEQAKEYLKIYKGFESLLNAASGGLPVDLSTLPIPPSQRENLEDSFAFVSEPDCDPNDEISDISVRMEEQLAKQLMMCKNTRDHHKAMGDVAGMNRFENLALTVQKDLDLVRYTRRKKLPLPKFHYETKSFNIVHCNTDLTDNEVEVNVIRGITYNVPNPKDVDTYVKIEFPYPQDYPFKARTPLVKNTDSPDYDQKYKIEIQRTNRQCQRIFKRHSVKFEVYSRGGFLRSDILIGTVNVKLQPLETKCELHDSFDLMDGRKVVGGKLEVKIRVRNPILTKQIEHFNEKWLLIDT